MTADKKFDPEDLLLDSAVFDYMDVLDYQALILVHYLPRRLPSQARTAGEWLRNRRELVSLIVRFEAGMSYRRLKFQLDPGEADPDLAIEDIDCLQLDEGRQLKGHVSDSWFRVNCRLERMSPEALVTPLQIVELCLWAPDVI